MWSKWYIRHRGEFNGVTAVYWNSFIRSVSSGMLGIFVPVYVFLQAKNMFGTWQSGVMWMLGYVVCQRVVVIGVSLKVGKLIERLGFRRSVLVATVLDICLYGLLIGARQIWWLVLIAGAISGLGLLFYWLPRMAMMAEDGEKKAFGHQVSVLMLIERGAEILGPFVGGVVIVQLGFGILFGIAIVLLSLSSIPLFFMAHHRHGDGVGLRELMEFVKEKEHRGDMAAFFGRGMDDTIMTWMWPIFMFLVIADFERMGGVASLTSVLAIVATFIAGKTFDRFRAAEGLKDEKVFWTAGVVTGITRLIRSLMVSITGILAIEAIDKTVAPFYWVPFDGYLYTAAKRFSPVAYFVFREIVYSLGRLTAVGIVVVVINSVVAWQLIMGVSAIGVFLSLMMSKESNR